MSFIVPLQPVANQSLTMVLDGSSWEIRLKALDQSMAVTVIRNNVTLLSGLRVVAEVPLIPYRYLESGNFIFISETKDLPFYPNFGLTQTLLYYSASELEAIRAVS